MIQDRINQSCRSDHLTFMTVTLVTGCYQQCDSRLQGYKVTRLPTRLQDCTAAWQQLPLTTIHPIAVLINHRHLTLSFPTHAEQATQRQPSSYCPRKWKWGRCTSVDLAQSPRWSGSVFIKAWSISLTKPLTPSNLAKPKRLWIPMCLSLYNSLIMLPPPLFTTSTVSINKTSFASCFTRHQGEKETWWKKENAPLRP